MDEALRKVELAPVHRKNAVQKVGSCLKSQNLSVDSDVKKEPSIVSSPSLDSSLRVENHEREAYLGVPKGSAISLGVPPHTPLTPHTPGSVFLSQTSQDSGFQSALSFDLPVSGSEACSRRRTTSSLTSGMSDWPNSIDSDFLVADAIKLDATIPSCDILPNNIEGEIRETKRHKPPNLKLNLKPLKKKKQFEVLNRSHVTNFADKIVGNLVDEAISQSLSFDWNIKCSEQCNEQSCREDSKQSKKVHKKAPSKDLSTRFSSCSSTLCWTPEVPYSPSHNPTSRRSSMSNESLVCGAAKDESHLITSAVSHDTLRYSGHDIYSSPVDTLKPYQGRILQPKAIRDTGRHSAPVESTQSDNGATGLNRNKCFDHSKLYKMIPFCSSKPNRRKEKSKKFSNIRNAIINLFSFRKSKDGTCVNARNEFIEASQTESNGIKWGKICPLPSAPPLKTKNSAFTDPLPTTVISKLNYTETVTSPPKKNKLLPCISHPRTSSFGEESKPKRKSKHTNRSSSRKARTRALPPLPREDDSNTHQLHKDDEGCDFASIIEKVKDYGWYWGPISGEAAEKVLSNEPDGSFIVRDSSDHHYIFSLTFRLNGLTRHVRIEHDQGNFSFGGYTRFKSQTIVDFIEKAVEHSRSGRYLFFLHRRPVLGPMRVQLLHPVSRFKHVQSLQHLCRFVIVKQVRRDLIDDLPLPQRLKDYLNSPHYYSELVEQCMTTEVESPDQYENAIQTNSSCSEATAIPGPSTASPSQLRLNCIRGDLKLPKVSPDPFKYSYKQPDSFLQGGPLYPLSPSTFKTSLVPKCSWINSWNRGSDSHIASFFSSPTSLQFSVTSPEFDSSLEPIVPGLKNSVQADVRSIGRSFSTGCLCKMKSAYPKEVSHKRLVSALALDTTVSDESTSV